ncbi:hypothetical protein [Actinopolymorpha sp. B9G3]|uniref:hypothetical protein n=1 Tax=Actinopolymorpha sp. B9G3 TaxID=3158970 RepID=UPI0032D8EDD5
MVATYDYFVDSDGWDRTHMADFSADSVLPWQSEQFFNGGTMNYFVNSYIRSKDKAIVW